MSPPSTNAVKIAEDRYYAARIKWSKEHPNTPMREVYDDPVIIQLYNEIILAIRKSQIK